MEMVELLNKIDEYPFLKVCDMFSGKQIENLSWWTYWDGTGWEKLWKTFLTKCAEYYDNVFTKEQKEIFKILDSKEKYGRLVITATLWIEELETPLEMLSKYTCIECGKQPRNSRGEHMIYRTKGYILPYCKKCLAKCYKQLSTTIKYKDYKKEIKCVAKNFVTHQFSVSSNNENELIYYWKEKDNWLYKEER